ncbi:MAG: hypothetical protein ACLTSX_01185 [Collinsella sp.]
MISERRQIRAVGEPRRRFEEDALRMLRAVRFACRLDFAMDPATAQALAECAPLLDQVARERVGIELEGSSSPAMVVMRLSVIPSSCAPPFPDSLACAVSISARLTTPSTCHDQYRSRPHGRR